MKNLLGTKKTLENKGRSLSFENNPSIRNQNYFNNLNHTRKNKSENCE